MDNQNSTQPVKKKGRGGRIALIICLVCLLIVASSIILFSHFGNGSEKAILRDALMQDWWKFEDVDGTLMVLILDCSKSEISFVASDLDKETVISTVEFEIISGNQFLLRELDTVFTVEFSDDGKQMTISPGLTSLTQEETWSVMARPYGTDE